jgi:hypothetical protein
MITYTLSRIIHKHHKTNHPIQRKCKMRPNLIWSKINLSEIQALEYRTTWEIYTPYTGAAGMLLHINENSQWESWNHFLCRKVSFSTVPHCQFRGVGQGFTFRYIDDVLSLNNSRFGDFVDRIYPIELEIKDTTDTDRFASYLDLHLEIDSEGLLRTKLEASVWSMHHTNKGTRGAQCLPIGMPSAHQT